MKLPWVGSIFCKLDLDLTTIRLLYWLAVDIQNLLPSHPESECQTVRIILKVLSLILGGNGSHVVR